jgi:protein-tyrosine phosphatase
VINITEEDFRSRYVDHPHFKILFCSIQDHPRRDISQFFESTSTFIGNFLLRNFIKKLESCEKEGNKILVHCGEGVSRSVTICLAFLVKNKGFSLRDAILHVQKKRPQANPNNGTLGVTLN